jgi:hypothetical protein
MERLRGRAEPLGVEVQQFVDRGYIISTPTEQAKRERYREFGPEAMSVKEEEELKTPQEAGGTFSLKAKEARAKAVSAWPGKKPDEPSMVETMDMEGKTVYFQGTKEQYRAWKDLNKGKPTMVVNEETGKKEEASTDYEVETAYGTFFDEMGEPVQ